MFIFWYFYVFWRLLFYNLILIENSKSFEEKILFDLAQIFIELFDLENYKKRLNSKN